MPGEGRGLSSRPTQDVARDREIGQPSNPEKCSEAADGRAAPLTKFCTGSGIESSGIYSNGLTLARKAFFKREQPLPYHYRLPKTGVQLGEELLRPTLIYVREVMEIVARVPDVKALINITSDGLLNLSRVDHPRVGFRIDQLPPVPEIFELLQQHGSVSTAEMFEVYNMGVGFCVLVEPSKTSLVLSILEQHGRKAWVIGAVVEDPTKGVRLPRHQLSGRKSIFATNDVLSTELAGGDDAAAVEELGSAGPSMVRSQGKRLPGSPLRVRARSAHIPLSPRLSARMP
jgi:AIR synthase related protein, C-terminal domain